MVITKQARIVDFTDAVRELTQTGHVSIADAYEAVLARWYGETWTNVARLRDAAIELQQIAETFMLLKENN